MIANIRGTSGSGKSTLVRRLMELYDTVEPIHIEYRARPFGYLCGKEGLPYLYCVGSYETPCGGGDTINGLDVIYDAVRHYASQGANVIYEGLIIQSDITRCVDTAAKYPMIVIGLNTTLEECLQGIQARRDARGDTKPLNPANTISKLKTLPRQQARLTEAGVVFHMVNREEAFEICKKEFGHVAAS